MTQTYDPKTLERRIYKLWEDEGYFSPTLDAKKPKFCIMLPPPNVTGSLHLGHALDHTIQDVLIRWRRMKGFDTLWQSGCDHAGIATQSVVERHLAEKGLERKTLGRESFLKHVWEWKTKYEDRIINQMKKLGDSCDWSRNRFTMDDGLSKAVKKVFINLYNEGLIYKGNKLVNWDTKLESAISDLEVEHLNKDGYLWHVKYPIVNSDEYLVVATTRPETIPGDTALAVNPKDSRYTKYVGKKASLKLVDREIKIIVDDFVDQNFGSGVVKITPAHDFKDYEVGLRHNLEMINILNPNGTLNSNVKKYEGLTTLKARKVILDDLAKQNLIVKKEKYSVTTPVSQRTGEIVEPYLSKQWFVSTKDISTPAKNVVEKKSISFEPEHWSKTYLHWMNNIQDWCISRQLWWGHRIPAWYCSKCDEIMVSESAPKVCKNCNSKDLYQDNDVLDTWFSSALWPFSTLGWPEPTQELKTFYPTSVLVTGHDIIFFWVARMIMSGLHHTKDIPFKKVFVHGIIRDEKGKKMSKSLGNTLDPLDLIEKYGADALRITLMSQVYGGNDIKFSEKRLEGYRNFLNKVFNANKFCMSFHDKNTQKNNTIIKKDISIYDRWIIQKLVGVYQQIDSYLEKFKFAESVSTIYSFVWNDFCDWYLELIKPILYKGKNNNKVATLNVLTEVLNRICRIAHPIIPHITEDIYQKLPIKNKACIVDSYPTKENDTLTSLQGTDVLKEIDDMILLITSIRNIRSTNNIFPKNKIVVKILVESHKDYFEKIIRAHKNSIEGMSNSDLSVENEDTLRLEKNSIIGYFQNKPYYLAKFTEINKTSVKFYIPAQLVVEKFDKTSKKIKDEIQTLKIKLQNQSFIEKAPKDIVEQAQEKLRSLEQEFELIDSLKKLDK